MGLRPYRPKHRCPSGPYGSLWCHSRNCTADAPTAMASPCDLEITLAAPSEAARSVKRRRIRPRPANSAARTARLGDLAANLPCS